MNPANGAFAVRRLRQRNPRRAAVLCVAGAFVCLGWGVGVIAGFRRQPAVRTPLVATVYKEPTCQCCQTWIDRMRAAGFRVEIHDVKSPLRLNEIKQQFGVPASLSACHTARVGDYVVEGHVPPDLVLQLLARRPRIVGLSVPGMPAGSPGMEGTRNDHYDVLAFSRSGATRVYNHR